MKQKTKYALVLLLISLVANVALLFALYESKQPPKVVPESEFSRLIESIQTEFAPEGYTNVLPSMNQFLALPNQSNDPKFPHRLQTFVYKGQSKGCVIMLQLSHSQFAVPGQEEWMASFDYAPKMLNESTQEHYNPALPAVQVSTHAFRYQNYYVTTTCFSDNAIDLQSPTELTAFTNALIPFLESKM